MIISWTGWMKAIVELYVYMTKRENLDHSYMRKFCPRRFSNFIFTPSIGSFGGLITMVNGNLFNELISQSHFQITVEFTCLLSGMVWYLYNICGPRHNKFREESFVGSITLTLLLLNIGCSWGIQILPRTRRQKQGWSDINNMLLLNSATRGNST
jgi:drug/metabolite transporter (DMT)-like permease